MSERSHPAIAGGLIGRATSAVSLEVSHMELKRIASQEASVKVWSIFSSLALAVQRSNSRLAITCS